MSKPRLGSFPLVMGQMDRVIDTLTAPPAQGKNDEHGKAKKPTIKRKPGRPMKATREITKSSQEGLKEGWTRASFIIPEETLERLKDFAYTERKQIKEVATEAIDSFLKGKKIIKRGRD